MTLSDWLQRIEKKRGKDIELGCERVNAIAKSLRLLPLKCPVITVAGTNGKGTTSHFLAHAYQLQGYRVGLFTSPHLLKFNERICINGEMAGDDALCDAFAKIEKACVTKQIELTFFEYNFLAALLLFKQAKIEVAVLEVGLGGRLDAVNIVDTSCAVITTISYDHQEYLGETREAIGYEKAGIMRAGKPCVIGEIDIPQTVIEHAQAIGASLICRNRDFGIELHDNHFDWWGLLHLSPRGRGQQSVALAGEGEDHRITSLPIPAIPLANAATAIAVLMTMQTTLKIDAAIIEKALANLHVAGRFEVHKINHIDVIFDVAHNGESAAYLAEKLTALPSQGKTYAVFSALADKDISAITAPFLTLIQHWYIAPLKTERAATVQTLARCLPPDHTSLCESVTLALQQALKSAKRIDRIIVFGSFYTVAAVLKELI